MKGRPLSFLKKNERSLSYLIVMSKFLGLFLYHLDTLC